MVDERVEERDRQPNGRRDGWRVRKAVDLTCQEIVDTIVFMRGLIRA